MPQIKSQFTPEQKKAFEENTNLGVYNHESLIELLMRQQEQIDEIAKNVAEGDLIIEADRNFGVVSKSSLSDKWNSTANEDHK